MVKKSSILILILIITGCSKPVIKERVQVVNIPILQECEKPEINISLPVEKLNENSSYKETAEAYVKSILIQKEIIKQFSK